MRLLGRLLLAFAGLALPPAVITFGCGDPRDSFPTDMNQGIDEPVLNLPGVGGSAPTGSTGTVLPGSLCDCAAARAGMTANSACTTCDLTAEQAACTTESASCLQDPACAATKSCVSACGTDQSCIDACILSAATPASYRALLGCTCVACQTTCPVTMADSCMSADAGTD